MTMRYDEFMGIYSLAKTLRFEAIPIGATKENFLKNGVFERDQYRAESYVKIKRLIDEFHKDFIDRQLSDGALLCNSLGKKNSLEEYYELYTRHDKDEKATKEFTTIKDNLRKAIAKKLTSAESYRKIFKKELIKEELPKFIEAASAEQLSSMTTTEALSLVGEFNEFTTYFTGFHENRKNMYTADEKSTGIAYRIIHDNLPKFVDNMSTFSRLMEIPEMQFHVQTLYTEMKELLNVSSIGEMFQLGYYNQLLTQKQIAVYNTIIGGRVEADKEKKIQGINEYVNRYNQTHKESKLPKLKMLFKQILSDREAISWLPEQFENDSDIVNAIKGAYDELGKNVLGDMH